LVALFSVGVNSERLRHFRVFHERINAGALIIAITRKTVPT